MGQAIRSALAQTWPNKEVIVVDDGSRDNTLAAAKAFESKHCKVLSQQNRGASAARNHAFCRVILASERTLFIPEARSYKRVGIPGNLSGRTTLHACHSQFNSMSSSIHRVLAVEDSERVRKICLTLLQNSMIYFYPEKTELMEKMNALARFLGGVLKPPRLG